MNLGGHLSVSRDPRATVARAAETGYRSMQIFASSPGAWRSPRVDPERAWDFVQARREYGIEPLFIHSIYLINLASAGPVLVDRSKLSLKATLEAAAVLGASGVVTHLGSHGGRVFDAVSGATADALTEVLDGAPDGVDLILENSAGAGDLVGADIREIGELIRQLGRPRQLKVAMDTAHLYAAGWDFRAAGTARDLVEAIASEIGLDYLALIHANDCGVPCGSRKDRHANIGDGQIGLDGFRKLMAQADLLTVPWILETTPTAETDAHRDRRVDDLCRLQSLAVEPVHT